MKNKNHYSQGPPMHLALRMESQNSESPRLRRCLNHTKQIRTRIMQVNNSTNREMRDHIVGLERQQQFANAHQKKVEARYRENDYRLQAMARVFAEISTNDLLLKIRGADYQNGLRKLLDDEVEKELQQNDSSSVSRRLQQKIFEGHLNRMSNSIEHLRMFDCHLVQTPKPEPRISSPNILFAGACGDKKTLIRLPHLLVNSQFEYGPLRDCL